MAALEPQCWVGVVRWNPPVRRWGRNMDLGPLVYYHNSFKKSRNSVTKFKSNIVAGFGIGKFEIIRTYAYARFDFLKQLLKQKTWHLKSLKLKNQS